MTNLRKLWTIGILTLLIGSLAFGATAQDATDLTLSRFFGACEEEFGSVTVLDEASGECGIVTVMINAFNDQSDAIQINVQGTEWGSYYDQLNAAFAGGNPPDIAVMHRTRLIDYVDRGLVLPIGEEMEAAGISLDDFAGPALDAVTVDGEVYGLPFDLHTLLWHVNVDVLAEAGLVDDDGNPILPSSPEELLEHAAMVKEATGKDYVAMDATQFPLGVRAVFAMIWQQDGDLLTDDASAAAINNEAGLSALSTMASLFEGEFANSTYDYATSEQAFLDGDAAILINGTWVVDAYTASAEDSEVPLTNYVVADFPAIFGEAATWSDTHMWAVTNGIDEDKLDEALEFLAFINDNNYHWSRTGHVSVRESVLESDQYQALPHRDEYTGTAQIARAFPRVLGYNELETILQEEFQAVWITGKSAEDALADAEQRINDALAFQ
jgi:multiple sugar transport system substrate-binding protein